MSPCRSLSLMTTVLLTQTGPWAVNAEPLDRWRAAKVAPVRKTDAADWNIRQEWLEDILNAADVDGDGVMTRAEVERAAGLADVSVSGRPSGRRAAADMDKGENASHDCDCKQGLDQAEEAPLPMEFSLPIIFVLVCMSGLFSGLTLGLMGLDVNGLAIVQRGDNEELARCAAKIAPVRRTGNQLLCTLLLGNVAVNSALSILMADIADGLVGFIVSTVLIVIFGEILPQAACSRYALQVGARTVPIVKVLMFAFYIVTKPMSIILDLMLGRDMGTVHTRAELMEMMKLQIGLGAVDEVEGKMAQQVAEGALSFRDKKVGEVMTPLEDAYMLSSETRLGYDSIREIFETGFSRVPVYGRDRHDYKGLLITRDLMLADPEDEMRLGDFIQIFQRKVDTVFEDTKLAHVLNRFKKGESHMALVRQVNTSVDTDPRVEIAGILTLEDVVEEIIQEEIVDETDVYVDVDNRVRVSDGRDSRQFQLGVFNPVWARTDRLSREEASAVASHLARVVFTPSEHLELSLRAVEWLVMVSAVSVHTRATPVGTDEPEDQDWLYRYGIRGERCTIVLQGRVGMRVGREGFRVEAGAFSILARDTLRPGGDCSIDFAAHVSTPKVRYLSITKTRFLEAKELDRDPAALERAWAAQAAEMVGESSRKEGRILRQQLGGAVPTDPYGADDSTEDADSHSMPSF